MQANGLDERFNQTLQGMLAKLVSEHQDDWDDCLDTCVFAYNTSVHESTQYSPFEVMFGRKATLPIDIDVAKDSADELLKNALKCDEALYASYIEQLTTHRKKVISDAKAHSKSTRKAERDL